MYMINIKKSRQGTTLIISYLVITVLLILGIAFTARSITESRIAERQKMSAQAMAVAEAGLERTLYELREDIENSTTWTDGVINGTAYTGGPDNDNFYFLPYEGIADEPTAFGSGDYSVYLKNVAGTEDEIWVRSTGTVGDISKTIQAYVKIETLSPWQNAIFAGAGQAGSIINGNVDIRGSVHILATQLGPGDVAIEVVELGGDGRIGNNYNGMDPALEARIPACPTVTFNEEEVESLSAVVRVRRGLVALSGSATLGTADVPLNDSKETLDAVYVTDGYAGNKGAENVYSDNGSDNPYDLGDSVTFPSLSDAYDPDGDPTYSHQEYLYDNAYIIDASKPAELARMADIRPDSTFSYGDANGQISMDGAGNMTIGGIVYIDGPLTIQGGSITYTTPGVGKGTILSTGNVLIKSTLLTPAGIPSFPATNALGIMTSNNITLGEAAQIDIMGAFYAGNTLAISKQTNVLGTAVGNYFDMGDQVPNIFQVPDLVDYLPAGMISGEPVCIISILAWQKI